MLSSVLSRLVIYRNVIASRSLLLFISPETTCDASSFFSGNLIDCVFYFSSWCSSFYFPAFIFGLLFCFFLYSLFCRALCGTMRSGLRSFFIFLACYLSALLPFSNSLVEFIYCFVALNISVYVLMLAGSRSSIFAGLCYCLLGAVATSFLFLGLGVWVSVFGDVSFYGVGGLLRSSAILSSYGATVSAGGFSAAAFACCFLFVPLLFKLGVFPFHFYLPMVYASVDRSALFVITVPVKLGVMFSFFGFVELFFPILRELQFFFWAVGLASVLVGAFSAAAENGWRRFWSYSYMNNVGTALLGLSFCGECVSTSMSMYYVVVYLVQWCLIYLLTCFVLRWVGTSRGAEFGRLFEIRYVSQLSLAGLLPACRWALYPILVSLAGIPPMLAFWTKFGVFASLYSQGTSFSLFVLLVAILVIPLNAFNYMRLVRLLAFYKVTRRTPVVHQLGSKYPFIRLNGPESFVIFFVTVVNTLMLIVPVDLFVAAYFPSTAYLGRAVLLTMPEHAAAAVGSVVDATMVVLL